MRLSFGLISLIWIASLGVAVGLKTYLTERPEKAARALASFNELRPSLSKIPTDFCEHGENYSCEWRAFGSLQSDSSTIVRRCVTVNGPLESAEKKSTSGAISLCVAVLKIMFRTDTATNALDSSAVRCGLQGAAFVHGHGIEVEAEDIDAAVEALHSKCQEALIDHQ